MSNFQSKEIFDTETASPLADKGFSSIGFLWSIKSSRVKFKNNSVVKQFLVKKDKDF